MGSERHAHTLVYARLLTDMALFFFLGFIGWRSLGRLVRLARR